MCKPTQSEIRRVIIAGAGPAGLLLQALLMNRNKKPNSHVTYDVTLIESRQDLGKLDPKTELQAHRSWMIGLAGHGLAAVRSVPGLYDEYLKEVGVELTEGSLFMGAKEMKFNMTEEQQENFIVDRNFIVAALARYACDNLRENEHYTSRYDTEMLYVDYANHRVLIRDKETKQEEYLPYDLLVGADGIRSTVREAMVKRHFDFELEVTDIFNTFKAVHIKKPEAISPTSISLLPNCLPKMNGICLPETGDVVNLSIGVSRNEFDVMPEGMKSDDPTVVAKYFQENFKAFKLSEEEYLDFAVQWVNQRWNRTGMVHCNMYSSLPCKIVLMGDAAHATSPSIGMGMNTALRDAQKFNELLDKFDDDLEKALPQYSTDRVPEGNALSDLALHTYCFDSSVSVKTMIKGAIRTQLHRMFPSLIQDQAGNLIGRVEYKLAELYQMAMEQGIISKHREINNRIRQEFFERQTGMIKEKPKSVPLLKYAMIAGLISCGVAIFINK
mmetsp:Transcript_19868/g.41676  ORF Transcript_19868/g.41676 Transcript_19868/m.41676 type:complete len:499 (-) Transcript_19868:337-1833(-)|eukprot:CAMPEP_0171335504 /NCGR_PEP_ID=MMETSP0878-20121228/5376_1 /TAXON_ID=67004 /ORGANISM="Thalassiosira weissflogii, Strain CCMP1336" /LENGTH=498 /DNA_ID=CAMNT_0011836781 /DNA_START=39 /DNA_END=1535 /DNA_ORIENTATION=-